MWSYSEPTVREGITLETHHDLSQLTSVSPHQGVGDPTRQEEEKEEEQEEQEEEKEKEEEVMVRFVL